MIFVHSRSDTSFTFAIRATCLSLFFSLSLSTRVFYSPLYWQLVFNVRPSLSHMPLSCVHFFRCKQVALDLSLLSIGTTQIKRYKDATLESTLIVPSLSGFYFFTLSSPRLLLYKVLLLWSHPLSSPPFIR